LAVLLILGGFVEGLLSSCIPEQAASSFLSVARCETRASIPGICIFPFAR